MISICSPDISRDHDGLTACSHIPDPAPADIITTACLYQGTRSARIWQMQGSIRVDRPSATSIFNTQSIVPVSPDGRRLSTVAQAKWPEGSTQLCYQETLIDASVPEKSFLIGVVTNQAQRTDTRVHLLKDSEPSLTRGEANARSLLCGTALFAMPPTGV